MALNSSDASKMVAAPRETISETTPQASAPATAEDKARRQAIFENGTNLMSSQPYKVQSGNPGGAEMPPYFALVARTPDQASVTSGGSVKTYKVSAKPVVSQKLSQSTR